MGSTAERPGERMTEYVLGKDGVGMWIPRQGETVLALDSGAERMGWAILRRDGKRFKSSIRHEASGYFGVPRQPNKSSKKTSFQPYRLSLIDFWIEQTPILFERYEPNEIVSETIPPVGGGNFVVAGQSHLALCAVTTVQVIAKQHGIPVHQIGATSVKKKIGGNSEATKVGVRNGIFKILPELEDRKKEWTKIFDVSDAIAIGLTHWGYQNPTTESRKQKKKRLNGK